MSDLRCFLLAGTLVLVPAFAAEAAGPPCGAFTLVGGEKAINVVDHAPAGKSLGDERVGWRALADEAGNPMGTANFVVTMTRPGAQGEKDLVAGQFFITLPDGWIAAQTIYGIADVADTSQKAASAVLVVTGGTGPYAGAGGTITIGSGDAPGYVFDLHCR